MSPYPFNQKKEETKEAHVVSRETLDQLEDKPGRDKETVQVPATYPQHPDS